MITRYLIDQQLQVRPDSDTELNKFTSQVNIVDEKDFQDFPFIAPEHKSTLVNLVETENSYLNVLPTCFVGSVAIPDRDNPTADPYCFAFYLDRSHLFFLDNGDLCTSIIGKIYEHKLLRQPTTAYCLFEFFRLLVKNDQKFLSGYEDKMEDTEESILNNDNIDVNHIMLQYRRTLLKLDTYYGQLVDIFDDIDDNDNNVLTEEEAGLFAEIQQTCERLENRVSTLREYSVQLRELHQTQIDTQQNNTMQLFTIITVLFVPLTLMTGWFGMNFVHFPGLDAEWAYPVFIVAVVIIVVIEIIIFRRRGWL